MRYETEQTWDLCVVGAGIAGLNALYAASDYLPQGAKVLLIDKRDRVGGMWNTTYDHVRLHQPHQLFTVGDIKWQLGKDRTYLADRFEVLEHMRHCLDVLRGRMDLSEWYGWSYQSHEESTQPHDGPIAHVHIVDEEGTVREVRAKRFIMAVGINVQPSRPFELDSQDVRPILPESPECFGVEMNQGDHPIYVVGGGKTGADMAYRAAKRYPGRKIVMLVGDGTSFFPRERLFPSGLDRFTGGAPFLSVLVDLASRYDGANEVEVYQHFLEEYALTFGGVESGNCVFGIMSQEEIDVINANVDVRNGFFQDVIDTPQGPAMVFRDGATEPIEPGSWMINCTGALLRNKLAEQACVSAHGTTLHVSSAAGFVFLSSISAHVLTHMWYRDALSDAPLWLMDHQRLYRVSQNANFLIVGAAQIVHNVLVSIERLPPEVLAKSDGLTDTWYPGYRTLWNLGKLRLRGKRLKKRLDQALTVMNQRDQVRRPVRASARAAREVA